MDTYEARIIKVNIDWAPALCQMPRLELTAVFSSLWSAARCWLITACEPLKISAEPENPCSETYLCHCYVIGNSSTVLKVSVHNRVSILEMYSFITNVWTPVLFYTCSGLLKLASLLSFLYWWVNQGTEKLRDFLSHALRANAVMYKTRNSTAAGLTSYFVVKLVALISVSDLCHVICLKESRGERVWNYMCSSKCKVHNCLWHVASITVTEESSESLLGCKHSLQILFLFRQVLAL